VCFDNTHRPDKARPNKQRPQRGLCCGPKLCRWKKITRPMSLCKMTTGSRKSLSKCADTFSWRVLQRYKVPQPISRLDSASFMSRFVRTPERHRVAVCSGRSLVSPRAVISQTAALPHPPPSTGRAVFRNVHFRLRARRFTRPRFLGQARQGSPTA
jgi:hypothetical protein